MYRTPEHWGTGQGVLWHNLDKTNTQMMNNIKGKYEPMDNLHAHMGIDENGRYDMLSFAVFMYFFLLYLGDNLSMAGGWNVVLLKVFVAPKWLMFGDHFSSLGMGSSALKCGQLFMEKGVWVQWEHRLVAGYVWPCPVPLLSALCHFCSILVTCRLFCFSVIGNHILLSV